MSVAKPCLLSRPCSWHPAPRAATPGQTPGKRGPAITPLPNTRALCLVQRLLLSPNPSCSDKAPRPTPGNFLPFY